MKKQNKFSYYQVIQGNYGYGWDDEDYHEVRSDYTFMNKKNREAFKENLNAYRENGSGVYRVVKRREPNEIHSTKAENLS